MAKKKSPNSKPIDNVKTKTWEKARRGRLKACFDELYKVLPDYDPAVSKTKIDVLKQSAVYITELLSHSCSSTKEGTTFFYKRKLEKLRRRIKELVRRIDQLTDLLRLANISIPAVPVMALGTPRNKTVTKWVNKRPLKWCNKFKIDEMQQIHGKNLFSEKVVIKKVKPKKVEDKKTVGFAEDNSPSQVKENLPVDFNTQETMKILDVVNKLDKVSSEPKTKVCEENKIVSNKSESTKSAKREKLRKIEKKVQRTNLLLPANNSVPQNTYILTNDGNLLPLPVINQTGLFNQTPVMSTSNQGVLTPLLINRPAPLFVLQKPQQPILQAAQIIPNSPIFCPPKPTLQIVSNPFNSPIKGNLPFIAAKPPLNKKRIVRDSTMTTFVNKVPISALSRRSYSSKKSLNQLNKNNPAKQPKVEATKKLASDTIKTLEVNGSPSKGTEKEGNITQAVVENLKNEQTNKCVKRVSEDTKSDAKKIKLEDSNFKPTKDIAVDLDLSGTEKYQQSLSPTAAFLSIFPIVATSKNDDNNDDMEKDADGVLKETAKSKGTQTAPSKESVSFSIASENIVSKKKPEDLEHVQQNWSDLRENTSQKNYIDPSKKMLEVNYSSATKLGTQMTESSTQYPQNTLVNHESLTLPNSSAVGQKVEFQKHVVHDNTKANCSSEGKTPTNVLHGMEKQFLDGKSNLQKEGLKQKEVQPAALQQFSVHLESPQIGRETQKQQEATNSPFTQEKLQTSKPFIQETIPKLFSQDGPAKPVYHQEVGVGKLQYHQEDTLKGMYSQEAVMKPMYNQDVKHSEQTKHQYPQVGGPVTNVNSQYQDVAKHNFPQEQPKHQYTHIHNQVTHFPHETIKPQFVEVQQDVMYTQDPNKPKYYQETPKFASDRIMTHQEANKHFVEGPKVQFKQDVPKVQYPQDPSRVQCLDTAKVQYPQENVKLNYPQKTQYDPTKYSPVAAQFSIDNTKQQYTQEPTKTQFLVNSVPSQFQSDVTPQFPKSQYNHDVTKSYSQDLKHFPQEMNKPQYPQDTKAYPPQMQEPKSNKIEFPAKAQFTNEVFDKTSRCSNIPKDCFVGENNALKLNAETKYSRPPVNWMTGPDIRSVAMQNNPSFGVHHVQLTQGSSKIDQKQFDGNRNLNTNQFKIQPPHEKIHEKSTDICKAADNKQNYNIFDYNYNFYTEDVDSTKFCGNFKVKRQSKKKEVGESYQNDKKKEHTIQNLNIDSFNANQDCYSWLPGTVKTMDWTPNKTFNMDNNFPVPSTLPTLVGDLALGINTHQEPNVSKANEIKTCEAKKLAENTDTRSEPFTNLSRNIFDVTHQRKNDFDNETIVLKNIFELPAKPESRNSKSTRNITQPQTFLSVSQLVETQNPSYETVGLKNDREIYTSYPQPKVFKNTKRFKNDRKYQNCKNYSAEALIRSSILNEFTGDTFYDPNKATQNCKIEFSKPDYDLTKHDFGQFVSNQNQNIYTDFNYSSPLQNFNILQSSTSCNLNSDFLNQHESFVHTNSFSEFVPEFPPAESILQTCNVQNTFPSDKKSETKKKSCKGRKACDFMKSPQDPIICPPVFTNTPTSHNNSKNTKASFYSSSLSIPTNTSNNIFPCISTAKSNVTNTPNNIFPCISSAKSSVTNIPNTIFPCVSSSKSNVTNTSSNIFPCISSAKSNVTNPTNNIFPCISTAKTNTTNTFLPPASNLPLPSNNLPFNSSSHSFINTLPAPSSLHVPYSNTAPVQVSSFLSLPASNPMVSSVPPSSSNSLANFNLSTIFPEINQKVNFLYP